jgi:hypothetical protein
MPTTPNVISLSPADWYLRFAKGVSNNPSTGATPVHWQFDFPAAGGEVAYVNVPFSSTEKIEDATLSMTFRVVSSSPAYGFPSATLSGAPALHLFMERYGDDFTAVGDMQYYRWWCGSGAYVLGSNDNQIVTVSCPLSSKAWSSVYGRTDEGEFQATLSNLQWVGFTLGGAGGWGHGVDMSSGSAQFQLLGIQIEPGATTVNPN